MELTTDQQIEQLDKAKELVQQDSSFYPKIIRGILPIAVKPDVRLRRWCSLFLADGFAAVQVNDEKIKLAVECLDAVTVLVNEDDASVLKNTVQCCASLYPLVYKAVCDEPDKQVFEKLGNIKSRVLFLWEHGGAGVKLACIKFVQRVVAVQTPGTRDPRLLDSTDISLSSVPPNHPFISPAVEAEAHGLLDRLLSVFYDTGINESAVSATLYAVAPLIKTRASIASRILTAITALNPLTAEYATDDPASLRMQIRFIEKNLRIVLHNLMKTNVGAVHGARIQQYLQQLVQAKSLTSQDILKMRETRPRPDQVSYASLYTLVDNPLTTVDATTIEKDVAVEIVIAGLSLLRPQALDDAIRQVRQKYVKLFPPPRIIRIEEPSQEKVFDSDDDYEPEYAPDVAGQNEEDDDDDYEPPEAIVIDREESVDIETYMTPRKLSPAERADEFKKAVLRVYAASADFESTMFVDPVVCDIGELDRVRLTGTSWATLLSRLSTRGVADESMKGVIRDTLFKHVTENFKDRADLAIDWLNEEWYAEKLQGETGVYVQWTSRILDNVIPFLDVKDRVFIRFLSHLPVLTPEMIGKLRTLCRDPDRSKLGYLALHYLIKLRPPVKQVCEDLIESLKEP